jgi:hypothetical protein
MLSTCSVWNNLIAKVISKRGWLFSIQASSFRDPFLKAKDKTVEGCSPYS